MGVRRLDVNDVVAVAVLICSCFVSVDSQDKGIILHTRFFGLVDNPMSFANADFVLVAALGDITKLLLKYKVPRRCLLLARLQLERCPWRRAERGDHIHRRLNARLREGDSRLALHAGAGWNDRRGREGQTWRGVSDLQEWVARVPDEMGEDSEALGDRVCFGRNIVSG